MKPFDAIATLTRVANELEACDEWLKEHDPNMMVLLQTGVPNGRTNLVCEVKIGREQAVLAVMSYRKDLVATLHDFGFNAPTAPMIANFAGS